MKKQLQLLENEKEELTAKLQGVSVADNMLAEVIEKYTKLYEETQNQREFILNEARKEAKELLDNSNRIIEKTIQEIKIAGAEKEKTKEVRKELETFEKSIPEPVAVKPPFI